MSKERVKKKFLAIVRVREKGKFVGFRITKQSHIGYEFEAFSARNGYVLDASSYPELLGRVVYLQGDEVDRRSDVVRCTKKQYLAILQAVKEYNRQDEKPKPIRATVTFTETGGTVYCARNHDGDHEIGCTEGIEKYIGARIPRNTTFTVRITEVTKKKSRKRT